MYQFFCRFDEFQIKGQTRDLVTLVTISQLQSWQNERNGRQGGIFNTTNPDGAYTTTPELSCAT